MKRGNVIAALIIVLVGVSFATTSAASVIKKGGRIYIEDRTGYKWDITEAQKRGFKPHRFNYGLGKDAFTPLQDEDLSDDQLPRRSKTKIIGISVGDESHAYSINRLVHHEIANTTISGDAIAVGY
jgi:hypothetical protein